MTGKLHNLKRFLIITILAHLSITAKGQSWESIRDSGDYFWGIGYGSSFVEADRQALANLLSMISTFVSSKTDMGFREENDGVKIDHRSYVENNIKTYSHATLTNTERIVIKDEPEAAIVRYIKKSELNRIFESRKAKAIDMVQMALRAETLGKADDALRNYYWALSLIRSLQYPDEITYTDDNGRKHILTNWIPEQMNNVFNQLKVSVKRRMGDDIELSIAYQGKPVSSVDFTYFDGREWSPINSAKDGTGILELAKGNQSRKYQIKFEYEYLCEAHIDKEIESVLNILSNRNMRNSLTIVDATSLTGEAYKDHQSFSQTDESIIKAPTSASDVNQYSKVINAVMQAIRNKNVLGIKQYFTKEGMDIFSKLLFSYGTTHILDDSFPIFYENETGEVTARGIKVSFKFRNGIRKSFVEDLVFTFNSACKIDNVAFGLGKTAEDDILNKGVWGESSRKALINFLENYKTAYALKRLDYINTIFDDDAVIIVGNIAKLAQVSSYDGKIYKNDRIIKYNRYSKDQYLKNLSHCFSTNEYINIRFANTDVLKLGKGGETYAIQISQDYYSSTYGDKGYLFLEIDINNPKQPIIKVRTWQPEKDPNFGIYGPGDFK